LHWIKQGKAYANIEQLIEAICRVVELSPNPIPIALMNHGVEEAAAIIGGVVEHCPRRSIALKCVSIDPNLQRNSASQRARRSNTEPVQQFIANQG
jgi:hypothetical protein